MSKFIEYDPESDQLYDSTRGYVRAERINDMLAKPNTKVYREYLNLVRDQFGGEPIIDPKDQYREKAKELVPNAIDLFEFQQGSSVQRNRLYFYHDEDVKICCAPDGIEGHSFGITVHCRQSQEHFELAKETGLTDSMERHAQAMMVVTGMPYWLHLNYFEDEKWNVRHLAEHETTFNKLHADSIEESMMAFLLKTRRRAA